MWYLFCRRLRGSPNARVCVASPDYYTVMQLASRARENKRAERSNCSFHGALYLVRTTCPGFTARFSAICTPKTPACGPVAGETGGRSCINTMATVGNYVYSNRLPIANQIGQWALPRHILIVLSEATLFLSLSITDGETTDDERNKPDRSNRTSAFEA